MMTEIYKNSVGTKLNLDALALQLGKHKTNVSRKARELGLTDLFRRWRVSKNKYATDAERNSATSMRLKARWKTEPHPRGMLGKKHKPSAVAAIASATSARWHAKTKLEQRQVVERGMETRIKNNSYSKRKKASWKAGHRVVGGLSIFFRSRWEFNYALYLEHQMITGKIKSWLHEAKAFMFYGEETGPVSMLPDFTVYQNDGSCELHEVKGWVDARTVLGMERMTKHYPSNKITMITKDWFLENLELIRTLPEYEEAKYY